MGHTDSMKSMMLWKYRAAKEVLSLVFSFFIFAFFSFPFFRHEEDSRNAIANSVRGRKGAQG
jgi:hypothetical protein